MPTPSAAGAPAALRIVACPDSFKGSIGSADAARAIAEGVARVEPAAIVETLPVADGGEGTVDALLAALDGERVTATVADPLNRPVEAAFGWFEERRLAVVEVAAASGLPLLTPDERGAERTTTYGTGELLAAALDRGAAEIVLGLGGSATVDGGSGLLAALGVVFRDRSGRVIERPAGGDLGRIAEIDAGGLDRRLGAVAITMASDVMNPLLGPDGAVQVFGPQKGLRDPLAFEAGMAAFADRLAAVSGRDLRDRPGSGAAGGIAAALGAFVEAAVRDGLSVIAERVDLDGALARADLAITGEGHLDRQSLMGKTPVAIARRARAADCACVALAGRVAGPADLFAAEGIDLAWPIVDQPMTLDSAMATAPTLIADATERLMRALKLGGRMRAVAGPLEIV